jgi:hypothetical protein
MAARRLKPSAMKTSQFSAGPAIGFAVFIPVAMGLAILVGTAPPIAAVSTSHGRASDANTTLSASASSTTGAPSSTVRSIQEPKLSTRRVADSPVPVTSTAARAFEMDLYFSAGYERQVDNRTCSAASTAMMMNVIAHRDLKLNQMSILRYEQQRDALDDRVQRGSDPLGWSKAATFFSRLAGDPTEYKWAAYSSKTEALKAAATALATYGKPVGLAVWHGHHAIVMTGFEAVGNPESGDFTLTSISTSDPYRTGATAGTHRVWTPAELPFGRYTTVDATPTYEKAWYGKWVIVVPTDSTGSVAPYVR